MKNESILTNCVLITMKDGKQYLFGEVIKDNRFEKGHHIRTTPLLFWDAVNKKGETINSKYLVQNLFDLDEYKAYLKTCYSDDEYINNLLFWALKE